MDPGTSGVRPEAAAEAEEISRLLDRELEAIATPA
jgi:hypothetical protein